MPTYTPSYFFAAAAAELHDPKFNIFSYDIHRQALQESLNELSRLIPHALAKRVRIDCDTSTPIFDIAEKNGAVYKYIKESNGDTIDSTMWYPHRMVSLQELGVRDGETIIKYKRFIPELKDKTTLLATYPTDNFFKSPEGENANTVSVFYDENTPTILFTGELPTGLDVSLWAVVSLFPILFKYTVADPNAPEVTADATDNFSATGDLDFLAPYFSLVKDYMLSVLLGQQTSRESEVRSARYRQSFYANARMQRVADAALKEADNPNQG